MAVMERDLVIMTERETLGTGLLTREQMLSQIDKLRHDLERLRLHVAGPRQHATLVGSDGTELEIPVPAYEILLWVLDHMAEGAAFTLAPLHQQLTTQGAADLLGVSRPHLIKLLDRREIPHTKTGTHRRVKLTDVLSYRDERFRRTGEALEAMAREEKDWELDDPTEAQKATLKPTTDS